MVGMKATGRTDVASKDGVLIYQGNRTTNVGLRVLRYPMHARMICRL